MRSKSMEKENDVISGKLIVIILCIFSFIFVFFNSKNSPLYLFNEWGDVNIYFSMGKGIANGLIPYKDIFDHKGPLIFFIYSLSYLISSTDFFGVYIMESIALFVNLLFAYKIARLYLNNLFSFITAACYAVILFTKSHNGGSAEEFISVFVTISFYYFILYFTNPNQQESKNRIQMFIHGAMFGLAFLSKLTVCVFWVPLMLGIGMVLLQKKKYTEIFTYALLFIGGFAATLLPFIIYFALNNSLSEAYFGYIEFNSLYAQFKPDVFLLRKTLSNAYKLLTMNYISFPLLLLGLFLLCFRKIYISNYIHRIGILFSFLFSFFIVSITKYIMSYAHMVIYVYAIFGLIFIFALLQKYTLSKTIQNIILVTSFLVLIMSGINDKKYFYQDIDCLTRKKECSYMQKEFAEIINKENNPTLLNIGLDFGLFTKANIVPTYKYFFYPNIPYHIFPEIRDYQVNLIEKKDPMFIVMSDKSAFYDMYKDLAALKNNYYLISSYDKDSFYGETFLYKRKD